jgi:hypothetical protein
LYQRALRFGESQWRLGSSSHEPRLSWWSRCQRVNWLAEMPLVDAYSRPSARSATGRRRSNTEWWTTSWRSVVMLKNVKPWRIATGTHSKGFVRCHSA